MGLYIVYKNNNFNNHFIFLQTCKYKTPIDCRENSSEGILKRLNYHCQAGSLKIALAAMEAE